MGTNGGSAKRRTIELRIGELVLHGLAPAARERIAPALEAELNRLFDEHGLPSGFAETGRVLHLEGGSFAVEPGKKSEQIGIELARALHRSWVQKT